MSARPFAAAAGALALVFLAFHLPYLPTSLDDLDSINFALGMRRFDVAQHQPHPPGYPLFVLAAKGARALVPGEAKAMAAISVVSAALGVLAMAALFRRLFESTDDLLAALMATAIAATAPLYWFTAARPLSDALGLSAALAVVVLILRARTAQAFALAAFCAGLATGIRSQVLWLTAPLLFFCAIKRRTQAHSTRAPITASSVAFFAGVAVWFIPLVVLSGGPGAYWHALFDQGTEDLTNIQMLWTSPTPRAFLDALYYAFVAPWASWWLASGVLVFAVVGLVALCKRDRPALTTGAVAFLPYLTFDILFQETFTSRYALPVVIPMAWLASAGIRALPQPLAIAAVMPIAMFGAHVGGRSVAAYSREAAPAFRLLAGMGEAAASARMRPVLAPDRRQSFDLRRPRAWLGDDGPAFDRQLAAPPQHEWLEAVKYWNEGGRAPVWFVVDPRRAAIDLVQHGGPESFAYRVPYPVLLSGTRPNDADWYRVDHPDWYVGEGWELTPEAAGVAVSDGKGLAHDAIHGWARKGAIAGGAFVLGGRNFESGTQPRLIATIAGREFVSDVLPAGFFLRVFRLPGDLLAQPAEYVPVAIRTEPAARVGIEQFDVATSRPVLGYGDGWYEHELNPVSGRRWRWLSNRGELRYITNGNRPVKLRISGESSRRYYSRPSHLIVRAGNRVLADTTVADDFTIEVDVPLALEPSTLSVETDQTHVPAEGSWRGVTDRRRLGLRIYACALVPSTASVRGIEGNFQPAR